MSTYTYSPRVFLVDSKESARAVILTPEDEMTTDERWAKETPYIGHLISKHEVIPQGAAVLDFGCGICRLDPVVREITPSCKYVGLDFSPAMRALAAGTVGQDWLDDRIWRGRTVDAVLAVWVLQHVADPERCIGQLRDVLRVGGRMFVVNNNHRAVPTAEGVWLNDNYDVRDRLDCVFCEIASGPFEISPGFAENTFWAVYERVA
jgi:SAM-dependent methyltransferase